jgi:ribosomal protein S18 acetylase RimI-like enzyme
MILMMEDEGLPFVTDIVVSHSHQKKGLGSFLLRYSQNALYQKYPCIRLSVNASNPAVRLYQKVGYAGDNVLTNFRYSL